MSRYITLKDVDTYELIIQVPIGVSPEELLKRINFSSKDKVSNALDYLDPQEEYRDTYELREY